ncbi:unnamed protein product [Protopolystoma xenopodis]|uniref:Uncharacterized protein n=1 Tax=Protopolystoma xenopodis TaxID=117903 RepID=A0A3S5CJ32_9PLAT|nr:unnamed protein product [Protopolystoma xenopodis]
MHLPIFWLNIRNSPKLGLLSVGSSEWTYRLSLAPHSFVQRVTQRLGPNLVLRLMSARLGSFRTRSFSLNTLLTLLTEALGEVEVQRFIHAVLFDAFRLHSTFVRPPERLSSFVPAVRRLLLLSNALHLQVVSFPFRWLGTTQIAFAIRSCYQGGLVGRTLSGVLC